MCLAVENSGSSAKAPAPLTGSHAQGNIGGQIRKDDRVAREPNGPRRL